MRDIFRVSQKISVNRRPLKVNTARGSCPAGLGCSAHPRTCPWTAGVSRPGRASSSASFSLKVSQATASPPRALASELCQEQEAREEVVAKAVSSLGSPVSVKPEGSSGLGSFYQWVSDLYRDTSSHLLRAGTRGTCGTVGARLPCSSIHRKAAVSEALTPGHALEAPGVSPEAHSFPEEA